ncbi:MAG: helix-turn-helix domain-containing protein [bacterium]|nr:helix-turn-helix domain-containing protein [bacterium]
MEEEIRSFSKIILEAMRYYDLNLEKLSRTSGISERYLEALLEEKFKQLPSAPYVHGYLSKIAAILNLNGEELWRIYLKDNHNLRRSGERDQLPPNRFSYRFWLSRRFIILGSAVVIVGLYVFFQTSFFFNKPNLVFEDLSEDSLIADNDKFIFRGKIEVPASLFINNEQISIDSTGSFEKTIYLNPGLNVFTFRAKKALGKELKIIKQIFYSGTATTTDQAGQLIENKNFPVLPEDSATGSENSF